MCAFFSCEFLGYQTPGSWYEEKFTGAIPPLESLESLESPGPLNSNVTGKPKLVETYLLLPASKKWSDHLRFFVRDQFGGSLLHGEVEDRFVAPFVTKCTKCTTFNNYISKAIMNHPYGLMVCIPPIKWSNWASAGDQVIASDINGTMWGPRPR
jgi:hypothetical protein